VSDGVTILFGALALDLAFGEPPAWLHPVAWMGRVQGALRRRAPRRAAPAFLWGAFMAAVGPGVFGGLTWLALAQTHGLVRWLLAVYLLKSAFSVRALAAAGRGVSRPLAAGHLDAARAALRSLVSRDTKTLTAPLVAAAAVESVAENASDSFVAPLFFFAIAGVPGAIAYRAVNTLDSMIGYRGELEWLGKAAARLDDLANLVPARVTVQPASVRITSGAQVSHSCSAADRFSTASISPRASAMCFADAPICTARAASPAAARHLPSPSSGLSREMPTRTSLGSCDRDAPSGRVAPSTSTNAPLPRVAK